MNEINVLLTDFKKFNKKFNKIRDGYWKTSEKCHNLLKKIEETSDEAKKAVLRMELLSSMATLNSKFNETAKLQDNLIIDTLKNKSV